MPRARTPAAIALALACAACVPETGPPRAGTDLDGAAPVGSTEGSDELPRDTTRRAEREAMVRRQIEGRGVHDPAVLRAMRAVPRHRFVPATLARLAYADQPLPIGHDQTISQPYIVAYMAAAADIEPGDRVLEIGAGSGYGAAVLAELAGEVFTIDIVPELAQRAAAILDTLGYHHARVRAGNGWLGWPDHAPYDAIVVTAAPDEIPTALVEQLATGGRLVIPVGERLQFLRVLEKGRGGLRELDRVPVRFVPMVAEPSDTT